MALGLDNIALRIGVWLDDLGGPVRSNLKAIGRWQLEELGLNAFGREIHPRTLSASGRRDLARLLRESGASLAALRADLGGRRLGEPDKLDALLTQLGEALALARDLGAARVVVPLGFVPAAGSEKDAKTRRTLSEAVKALVALAAQYGVRPVVPAGSEPPEDLAALLDAFDRSELVGVDLQPGRLVARGVEPLDGLNVLGGRVALATAADFYRGGGEASFGAGDVPWGHAVVGLSTLKQGAIPLLAACSRECDRVQALGAVVEGLRKLRANPMG